MWNECLVSTFFGSISSSLSPLITPSLHQRLRHNYRVQCSLSFRSLLSNCHFVWHNHSLSYYESSCCSCYIRKIETIQVLVQVDVVSA